MYKYLELCVDLRKSHMAKEALFQYRLSGQVDYLLKIVVPDIAAYDEFYKRLVAEIDIEDVSSVFAMERIKDTTEMPLSYLELEKG